MRITTFKLPLGLCAAGLLAAHVPAHAGKTLDAIKARGQFVCGVNPSLPGFSAADSQGNWSGLDVDICKADRGGHARRREEDQVGAAQRRAALHRAAVGRNRRPVAQHHVDADARRVARPGLHRARRTTTARASWCRRSRKITSAKQLKGATVCVQSGTTTEKNLTDYSKSNNLKMKPVVFETLGSDEQGLLRRPLPGLHDRCLGPGLDAQQGSRQSGRPRDPARTHLQGAAGPVGAARRRRVVHDRQVGRSSR